jgi:hypothetical protein
MNDGVEVPLRYCAGALVLACTGPGAYSLDAALGLRGFETREFIGIVLVLAVIGALGAWALRHREAAAPAAPRGGGS